MSLRPTNTIKRGRIELETYCTQNFNLNHLIKILSVLIIEVFANPHLFQAYKIGPSRGWHILFTGTVHARTLGEWEIKKFVDKANTTIISQYSQ